MKFLQTVFLIFACSVLAQAQPALTIDISGYVYNDFGSSLEGVTIDVQVTSECGDSIFYQVVTDNMGSFSINDVPVLCETGGVWMYPIDCNHIDPSFIDWDIPSGMNNVGLDFICQSPACNDIATQDWVTDILNSDLCNQCVVGVNVYEYEGSQYLALEGGDLCPDGITPVYSCNGNLYCYNGSIAGVSQCVPFFNEATLVTTLWSTGDNCDDCICTDHYEPVCGNDGNTYGNPCEANCAGITIFEEGECNNICNEDEPSLIPFVVDFLNDPSICDQMLESVDAYNLNGDLFIVMDYDNSADAPDLVYSCDGNLYCSINGLTPEIDSLCIIFFEEATLEGNIWIAEEECNNLCSDFQANILEDTIGGIFVTITGGTAPYIFQWSNFETTQYIFPNTPGTYCVTIIDANGCYVEVCYDYFGNPECEVSIIEAISDPQTSTILTADGQGTPPFSYQWSNGANTQTIEVFDPGLYCVTLTDANGCYSESCFEATFNGSCIDPSIIDSIPCTTIYDPVCGCDGVTYSNECVAQNWYGITSFTLGACPNDCIDLSVIDTLSGCDASYDPVCGCDGVTYSNECVALNWFGVLSWTPGECTVSECDDLNVSISSSSGVIAANSLGGTPPYDFQWSNGANTPAINVTDNGTYCVTVIDANDCNAIDCIIYTNVPDDCGVSIYQFSNPGDSTIYLEAEAFGTPPFTYLWNTGETDQLINVYDPGDYCVIMTDANGCASEHCYIVEDLACNDLEISFSFTDTEVLVDVSGGTPPYAYTWLPGQFELPLPPGTYCIDVTDAIGCYASACFDWGGNPDSCYVYIEQLPIINTGELLLLEAEASGVAPFSYIWNTGETTQAITAIGEGTYCVSITDVNGCLASTCIDVVVDSLNCYDPWLINLDADCSEFGYDPVCGCDGFTYDNACIAEQCFGVGEWTAGPCGGTNPDTTLCSTNASFEYTIEEQGIGVYKINLNGSTTSTANPAFEWLVDGAFYSSEQDISISVQTQDSFYVTNVCLEVADTDACFSSVCETIVIDIDPDGIIGGSITEGDGFTGDDENKISRGSGDEPLPNVPVHLLDVAGNILQTAITNKDGNYQFEKLFFGDYYVQVIIEDIPHEPYHVKLSPLVQLDNDLNFVVTESGIVSNDKIEFANKIEVFPNPANDYLNINIQSTREYKATLQLVNLTGQIVKTQAIEMNKTNQSIQLDISELPDGIYLLSIQNEDYVSTKKVIVQ